MLQNSGKRISSRFWFLALACLLLAPAPAKPPNQPPVQAPAPAPANPPAPLFGETPAAAPPAKTSLAVYPISTVGLDPEPAEAMTGSLTTALTQSPKLQVVEQVRVKFELQRQERQGLKPCADLPCMVEFGKLVKAGKIVAGRLSKQENLYILEVKIIDVSNSNVEFHAEDRCACPVEQLEDMVATTSARIRNHFGEALPVLILPQKPPPAPVLKTLPEIHPQGAKGGPMLSVTDFKFFIDKYEVTHQDYDECVAAKACEAVKKQTGFDSPKQPVVLITQDQAHAYCEWAGKRLPTFQEWQQAAQGTDEREYPWGNEPPNCNLANYYECNHSQTLPVGSKPAGASPYGAMDMSGNVWEWVEGYGQLRGGGWNRLDTNLRVTSRDRVLGAYNALDLGFRCARDGSP